MDANLQTLFETETHSFYTPTSSVWETGWSFLWVIESLLFARLLLQLFSVSSDTIFGNLLYTSTDYLLLPFTLVFGFQIAESSTLNWVTVIAMACYWVLVLGITTFFGTSQSVSKIEIARVLNNKKYGGYR
jgi:hypothetical protein